MKELFVPYEIALTLKEKGFREKTRDYYRITGAGLFESLSWIDWNNDKEQETAGGMTYVSTPLYQQVVDWFRERNIRVMEFLLGWEVHSHMGNIHRFRTQGEAITYAITLI